MGATYVELAANGQYKVIDREHMVVFLTDAKKDLDADPNHLPSHVLFKITAKTYSTERKETYPFRYIGPKQ